ncbi:MAG TPA: PQQ-dependent sugar dehydrogenase, partial [Gammaproteobacteria bacterium]|nr:PQQ-dependent sugar dehydrogenase [Gammaproteobacteria bacterium]
MRAPSSVRACLLGSAIAALIAATAAAQTIQRLPEGAGALGKGPDAIVLPGYADAPRPPAFDEAKRREVLQQSTLVDDAVPQPAFLGQTRAPKPAKPSQYRYEVAVDGIDNPWSLAFLPDGRMLVSETNRGLVIIGRDGKVGEPITKGLPLDFSKRGQELLDSVPDRDFARNRTVYLLFRKPPPEAGDVGKNEEDFPVHYPQIEMAGSAQLAKDEKSVTNFKLLLNVQGIEGR